LAPGESEGAGIASTVRNLAFEGLVAFLPDGRPDGRIAERWVLSDDGRALRLKVRDATFHDGDRVTASMLQQMLTRELPAYLGTPYEDVKSIEAVAEDEIEFQLQQPSTFLVESLDLPIRKGSREAPIGTGPFKPVGSPEGKLEVEMLAHQGHYGGRPVVDRLLVRSYPSVRSAWAELLRGDVDMLYDVGIEGRDSLASSKLVKVYEFQRPYAYTVILNSHTPALKSAAVRRALNFAIDRDELIANALRGHGTPAEGAVWPLHWAYDSTAPRFEYKPEVLSGLKFRCMYVEGTHERLALALEQQLRAVGVELVLEPLDTDEGLKRLGSGDFEAALIDVANGPLVRPFWFWHTSGNLNYARFSSRAVDTALGRIQHAATDTAYEAGVSAFQQAIFDDPPAIFLAWSERARAVSTRFEVRGEPGRDVLTTLRLWRLAADTTGDNPN
jgi:peptide/nickel transport system substrate-binding protein